MLVIPVLGIAGLIEGFLSPSGAPDAVKAIVGIVTGALLWGYIAFAGRPSRRSARGAAPAS